MMELPESYTLSRQITKELSGKIISEVVVLKTPHKFAFFKGDTSTYADLLERQTITGATFKGGMLEIDTEDAMLVFSDGVTLRYYTDKKLFPKNHQLALMFDDETALICTIRMYGFLDVCPLGTCEEDFRALYESTVKIVRKMCQEGGRDTESDLFGKPGGYITQLSKKSYGEPCMKCGSLIHRTAYMGGNIYFCEKCQKQ